jgi:hypothetical protein
MKSYKKWSAADRSRSLKLTKAARKYGWIQDPKKCNRCKQTEGIIHLHNENYDVTLNILEDVFSRFPVEITKAELDRVHAVLEPLCWRCHMMHHSTRRNKYAVEKYFNEIKQGKQYPPVYRHDFTILNKDHNV